MVTFSSRTISLAIAWAGAASMILSGTWLLIQARQTTSHGPGLVPVNVKDLDQGTLSWGEHEITVDLLNNSVFPITLKRTETLCDCTRVEQRDGDQVAAGQSVPVKLRWKTHGQEGAASTTVRVWYLEQDRGTPKVCEFAISARIQPAVSFEPKPLTIQLKDRGPHVVRIAKGGVSGTTILDAIPSSDALSVALSDDRQSMIIYFDESKWNPTAFPERIRIHTSYADFPTVSFPVRIEEARSPMAGGQN